MSAADDPVELARQLIRMDSINPPGGEEAVARYLAGLLEPAGFDISYFALGQGRSGLLAKMAGKAYCPPMVWTGHLDTVPLGNAPWSFDPLAAEIKGGMLLGRGASDMKSGVAAMTTAALRLAEQGGCKADLYLAFTAAEETGCEGALQMAQSGDLPANSGALLVAEPSGNRPFLGHKGALWLECVARGKSAHGSMPDMGENAIYKAARAAAGLEDIFTRAVSHPKQGKPTVNVGVFSGGSKINMVPDHAEFQVDLRTVEGMRHEELFDRVVRRLGGEVEAKRLIDLPGFLTPEDDPWITAVLGIMEKRQHQIPQPGYVNYFTDASVLRPALGDPPTLILGPGDPGQAHQTDEYCPVGQITQAADLYVDIARGWPLG